MGCRTRRRIQLGVTQITTRSVSDGITLNLVNVTDRQASETASGDEATTASPLPRPMRARRVTAADLERRARGYELYRAARAAGFAGAAQKVLEQELWRYGLPVMLSMLRTGTIISLCARYKLSVQIPDAVREILHLSQEERDALAVDTIAAAVPFFTTKVLAEGGWDPEGASLQTYFVGALAHTFPGVFRSWYRNWKTSVINVGSSLDLDGVVRAHAQGMDPAELATLRDTLARVLARADEQTRAICAGVAADKTYAEIGAELHLTAAAVEGRMYRLRQTARKMARRGEIHAPTIIRQRTAGAR